MGSNGKGRLPSLKAMKYTCIALLSAALAEPLFAATYHVDQSARNASDTNPGTQYKPFKNISAGAAVLKAGDTLLIHRGVYRETVRIKESGTAKKPIVIQAATKGTVTIRGSVLVSDWRRSEENSKVFIHDGWHSYFGEWDESLVKGGDQFKAKFSAPARSASLAFNQVFVNGALIREVACPEKREAGTFYIDKERNQIHLWLAKDADPNQCSVEVTDRDVLLAALKVSHLQVKGLSFEYCANGMQQAAVNIRGGSNNLIEDCVITHTAMVGLRMAGDNHVVRRCVMNDNGQEGFSSSESENILIEDCETSHNNCIPWKRVYTGFEAGGFKVALSHKVKFLRHKSIGNYGPGLWFDVSNDEMEVANCFVADNDRSGVMSEISSRIHVHDSVIVNNKGGGVKIAESPGALIERNVVIGNEEGVQFRDMLRSTPEVSIIHGRSVKGEKTAIWNHDEVVHKNVFVNNTRAQVNFGVNGINANRQVPERLQQRNVSGKKVPLDQETRDAEEYQDKSGVPQPVGLSLEKLNFVINGNVYWGGETVPLTMWGGLIRYQNLQDLRAGEGFEKDGVVLDPKFADWEKLDLRVAEDSPVIKMGSYPRGEVPGVRLGIIKK